MTEYTMLWLVVVALAGVVGWKLREFYAVYSIRRMLEENDLLHFTEESAEEPSDVVKMEVNREGEQIYAYDMDDNFLAQGLDAKELDDALKRRFPGKKFEISEATARRMGWN